MIIAQVEKELDEIREDVETLKGRVNLLAELHASQVARVARLRAIMLVDLVLFLTIPAMVAYMTTRFFAGN